MKEKIEWFKSFANAHDFKDWFSIGAGILMGVVNLMAMIHGKSMLFAALLSFYFGFALMRMVLLLLKKTNHTRFCTMGLITSGFLFFTMPIFNVALFVLAAGEDLIHFPFRSMIYGYAFYAFYKAVSAIMSIREGRKQQSAYLQCVSILSLLSAAYTMLSLTANLVYQLGTSDDPSMKGTELALLVATMIYIVVMIIWLDVRGIRDFIKYRKEKQKAAPKMPQDH